MDIRTSIKQLLALSAFIGAASLTACGGGGGGSSLPSAGQPAAKGKVGQNFTAFIPKGTGTSSGARHTQYIDSSGTSSLLVTVTPGDPAELAQFGTFSVCYNLFTNGVATPSTGVTITPVVGPPAGFNVSFNFPAPPGQDNFVLTQYAGACSPTNPYVAPTPGPGQSASNLIISQSQALSIYVNPGTSNGGATGFNIALYSCTTPAGGGGAPGGTGANGPGAPGTCAVPVPGGGSLTPSLGATLASVYLGGASPVPNPLGAPIPLPIVGPIREQGAFVAAGSNVGLPIPVVGLDSNGFAVPYTAGVPGTNPPSSGLLPKAPLNPACSSGCTDAITVSHTEADVAGGPHGKLYMIDAATGAVVQVEGAGAPITLTALNGIDTTDIAYGGAHGAGGGVANDPYVIVLVTDGTAATQVTSYTISLGGQFNGAALTAQTRTINPQATIFSTSTTAPNFGYADPAAPYLNAADVLNAGANGFWVSDLGNLHKVGVANHAVAGATTLTGMTLDTFTGSAPAIPVQILAVDNSVTTPGTPSAVPIAGGVYVFDPVAFTNKPLAIQNQTTQQYTAFQHPVGIAYQSGGYVYVAENNKIDVIDPQGNGAGGLLTSGGGAFFQAEQIGTLAFSGTGPNFGTWNGIDMLLSGTKLTWADPGNNRIAQVDLSTCGPPSFAACAVSALASGHPFVGLSANGTGFVASDTTGQLYAITATGAVTSFGVTTGAVADGPIGVLAPPATGAAPYVLQGNANNFFSAASTPTLPYNIPPFSASGPVLAGAAQAAVVGAPLKLATDTSNQSVTATTPGSVKSPFGIVFVSAAQATNNSLTKDSYLFTDLGNVRTLVP